MVRPLCLSYQVLQLLHCSSTGASRASKLPLAVAVNEVDHRGRTALSLACEAGRDEVVASLLGDGQALSGIADNANRRPLHYAQSERVVRELLARGANDGATDDDGAAALVSRLPRQAALVRALLEAGADARLSGPLARTPLHNAARCNDAEVAFLLLERGAEPDARDSDGMTPLACACSTGATRPLINLLPERGADCFVQDNDGNDAIDHLGPMRVPD